MTWERILATGSGSVRYAIVIEGWPEIWVTDSSITLTDSTFGKDGRTVRVGLTRKGLKFGERALLAEGKFQGDAMRFRVVSADQREHALESFARVGQQVGILAEDVAVADDELVLEGDVVLAPGYYHIGTEAISLENGDGDPANIIVRALWDTQAQAFEQLDADDLLTHKVYAHPTTAEGRRLTLYAWGDGDDGTKYDPTGAESGAGVPVWRGIISVPPQIDRDGLTWIISADHIHSVFRQEVAARGTLLQPQGIYHSSKMPIYVAFHHDDTGVSLGGTTYVAWHATPQDLADFVSDILQDYVTAEAPDGIESINLLYTQGTDTFTIHVRTDGTGRAGKNFRVFLYSYAMGTVATGETEGAAWRSYDNTVRRFELGAYGEFDGLDANEDYYSDLQHGDGTYPDRAIACEGTKHALTGWANPLLTGFDPDDDAATLAAFSPRKIYINQDWSALGAASISIRRETMETPTDIWIPDHQYREGDSATFLVTDSGYASSTFWADTPTYWIEVEDTDHGNAHHGFIGKDTAIRPLYGTDAAAGTDAIGFVQSLIDKAEEKPNDGNVPFIRDTDFDTTYEVTHMYPELTSARQFAFSKATPAESIIAEELKLIGHMWSTTSVGKMRFVPMPILTGNLPVSDTIEAADILTPEGGQGAFPSYQIQAQGLVSTVTVKQGYDPEEDAHTGYEFIVRDATLLSTHKRRGVTSCTIAPKSNPVSETEVIDLDEAQDIAARLLSVLGREYAVIRVRLGLQFLHVRLGDAVALTSPHVPSAPSGSRGVSAKRCFVIGREVNLDPADPDRVELELLTLLNEVYGYAPAGVVTDQTDNGGDEWDVELDSADAINILLSPTGNGDVAGTFAVGDKVRVVRRDQDTPTTVSGTVASVSGEIVTVQFDATWTPSTHDWRLEYADATDATDTQKLYAFVAEEDGLIDGADPARDFA